MSTVFETLSDRFYTTFFESDPEKRQAAIEAWIKDATPVVQSAVENELRSYLEYVLEQTWTTKGWQSRAKKFCGTTQDFGQRRPRIIPFMDGYRLRLDLCLTHPWANRRGEKVQVIDPVSPEAHAEALRIAQQTLSQIDPAEAAKLAKQLASVEVMAKSPGSTGNTDEDGDYDDTDGRSPNDDRSDSMNPNNDAYWSSRGR